MSFTREHFDGGSVPSPWTAVTAGTGTVAMSDSCVVFGLNASGDSASIIRSFDHTRDAIYWMCAQGTTSGAGPTPWPDMRILHAATQPTPAALSTFSVLTRSSYYNSGGYYSRVFYAIAGGGGTNRIWDYTAGGSWGTGSTLKSMVSTAPASDYRLYGLQWDATNARFRWCLGHMATGSSENIAHGPKIQETTEWVALSDVQDGGSTTLWMSLGECGDNRFTTASTCAVEWFSEQWGDPIYMLANGKATVGATYNITEHVGYDLRAGLFFPVERNAIAIDASGSGWDDFNVQWGSCIHADDGNYVASFSGNVSAGAIQTGIAIASSPGGPWTKSTSNPVLAVAGGTDYSDYIRQNTLIEDWQEADPAKRYKLLVNGTDASAVSRMLLFYAADYEGPYTFDGRFLEEDATETTVVAIGQPVWDGGQWYILYNCVVAGDTVNRYATAPTLRAGQATKGGVTLATSGLNGVEVTLTAVSGRTWTVADTTGLVKDMELQCTKTTSAGTSDLTRVRKVLSSTQFEVYHTASGAAVGTVCRSTDYASEHEIQQVLKIDGTWHWLCAKTKVFQSHASYSAHYENNALYACGTDILDPPILDWATHPVVPYGSSASNTAISNENVRLLMEPPRFHALEASLAMAVTGTEALTLPKPVAASAAIAITSVADLSPGAGGAALAATPAVALTGTEALTVPKPLAATAAVALTASEALAVPKPLAASTAVALTGTRALTVPKPLDSALGVVVTSSEALTVPKPVATALAVALSAGPDLSAGGSGAALQAALTMALASNEALTVPKPVATALAVALSAGPDLSAGGSGAALQAGLAMALTSSAVLVVPKPLASTVVLAVTSAESLTVPKDLATALALAIAETADLSALGAGAALAVALGVTVTPVAVLTVPKDLVAAVTLALTNGATLTSVIAFTGVRMIAGVVIRPAITAPPAIAARFRGVLHISPESAS